MASDLPELLRNSDATVQDHYSSGLLTVQTIAGNVRTYKQSDLYLLTGDEALPMAERTPKMTVSKTFKLDTLAACGGRVNQVIKHTELVSDEHILAGFHEMSLREMQTIKQDVWPNPLIVCLDPAALTQWLHEWDSSLGSPVSQADLVHCRGVMQGVLQSPQEAGFVAVPVCAGGHWTLLLLLRKPPAPDQVSGNLLELVYLDSLSDPSTSCR